ncbi:MAG: glycoside hydrolase domain-containing protein [Gemmatimonadales bacterium]
MKPLLCAVVATLLLTSCSGSNAATALYRAPEISHVINGVIFEAGNWKPHLAAGVKGSSWGNHRAVVVLDSAVGEAVMATIPWRRHDPEPRAKSIVVVDATSNKPISNVLPLRVENVSGDIAFQPNPGSATYYVYYMPWESTGGNYPRVTYPKFVSEADATWERHTHAAYPSHLPRARTTRIQSVNEFHSFFPMEIIASDSETAAFMSTASDGWALVPEYRDYPVRMRHFIPYHWAGHEHTRAFTTQALRGEYVTFQLAVVTGAVTVRDVHVTFEGFPAALGETLTCFNCGGINERGQRFVKDVSVPAGTVQPLWIGLAIPEGQSPGTYEGDVTVSTARHSSKTVRVTLDVQPDRATNHGFDSPELMTRLAWLNSTAGTDPDFIIEPYDPVRVDGHSLTILGRTVELGASGLPDQVLSYFSPELTHLADAAQQVLARPMELEIVIGGRTEQLQPSRFAVRQEARGRAEWHVEGRSDRVAVRVEGALEYDGMLDYRITLEALRDLKVDDITFPISLRPEAAEYILGLGFRGGKRPQRVDWKWKIENHQEGVWLGGINAGLQYVLRDDSYVRPLNTNFYQNQPLRMPASWFNGGRGGIRIETRADDVTAFNYSGARRMTAGDTLEFNVRFLLTPFKTIDTRTHFRTRFVHRYVPVDSVVSWGGTVVNIHHANEINPYINYPFFNLDLQTAYITEAHAKGIKVKLYDTIRELTYHAYELFALRSLGDEILNDGEGGGHSWMQEHLEDHYHSAWHAWRVDDAAMLDKGTSRWTNYYIEGLAWLAANQHIDGLYLDDIAFSRETVKRMISVLHARRDTVIIDLHSANQFNPRDGYINSAMLYMEHFPFISRLWFGEYFEYDRDEDYWLTEVSGLPFGLMGEMLQDGGRPYRGMLYGMTARMYGDIDPRPMWQLMDQFGIAESRMLGYWLDSAPVKTNHPRILATTYVRPDGLLIALASWSPKDETVSLTVDPSTLGVAAGAVSGLRAYAPAVEGLQDAAEVDLSQVQIPANRGLFVLVRPKGKGG